MSTASRPERLETGISAFDRILDGGLPKGGVYVVLGPPGSGKTILANQICFHHARIGGKTLFVTLLAESHARMITNLREFDFFDPEAVPARILYTSLFKVVEDEGLDAFLTVLRQAIASHQATLLVVDGLVSAEESTLSTRSFKRFVHELQSVAAVSACTVLLLTSTERSKPFRPEHTMVDGIIEMRDERVNLRSIRRLEVPKMRGVNQIRGQHTFDITDEGIVVVQRFETAVRALAADMPDPGLSERIPFGMPELDRMLEGGLTKSSLTMLFGPSGCGKTLLGLKFLAEGARQRQPGLYFGFYERPALILEKSKRVGMGLEDPALGERVELLWHRPVEGTIDVLGERLLSAVRRRKVQRLFIDGLHGFEVTADSPGRIRDVFGALAYELERAGVTTVYTVETRDLFGGVSEVPMAGLSAVTQSILVMRYVETNARLHRAICVLKMRDSQYDAAIRELRISSEGIQVEATFDSRQSNILSGVAELDPRRPELRHEQRHRVPAGPKRRRKP